MNQENNDSGYCSILSSVLPIAVWLFIYGDALNLWMLQFQQLCLKSTLAHKSRAGSPGGISGLAVARF
jgi:hypothetical protein